MNSRLYLLLGLLLASALLSGCTNQNSEGKYSGEEIFLTVIIQDVNGNELRKETFSVLKGSNGLEAMKQKFELEYKESAFGVYIQGIDGTKESSEAYWGLFVDGEFADKALDRYVLLKDTEIKWKLMTFEEMSAYWN